MGYIPNIKLMTKIYSKIEYCNIYWYKEGTDILHREDGPAVEYADGEKRWYQNGKIHRVDGPAIEYPNGSRWWVINGQFHRTDGPALEMKNSYKQYWLYGNEYSNIHSDEEWIIFQILN